jgi:GNAT superfamily N-acetyltransferase
VTNIKPTSPAPVAPDSSIRIRPALAADAQAIGRLAREFAGYLRSLGDHTDFKLTAETCLQDGFGPSPAFSGIVAEAESTVIGYLLYHLGYDSDAAARNLHVADLYVAATERKHGVGRALMRAAAEIAREAGAPDLIWSVYKGNEMAAAFYETLGAQRIDDVFFMHLKTDALCA